jgi:hypothetical protein
MTSSKIHQLRENIENVKGPPNYLRIVDDTKLNAPRQMRMSSK